MSSILSTRLLSPSQKELLLNAKQNFVDYSAISIEYLTFKIDEEFNNYIFTSQNGVKAFLKSIHHPDIYTKNVFCVGEKTKLLLEENNLKVLETAENTSKLSKIIVEKYKNSSFFILSGNLRRPELSEAFKINNVRYKEVICYNTTLNYKRFDSTFDGILFFSPSGVLSFTKENSLTTSWAFCIGETTGEEAKKHTDQVVIANKPTIENVLVQAIKHFNSPLFMGI